MRTQTTAAIATSGLLLLSAGCATSGRRDASEDVATVAVSRPSTHGEMAADCLSPGEKVYVFLGSCEQLPREEYLHSIRGDGCLTLPNVGKIRIAGMTVSDAERRIESACVPYYYSRLNCRIERLGETLPVATPVRAKP